MTFDISKAKKILQWAPKWTLFSALDSIIEWEKAWVNGEDIKTVTLKQISEFEQYQ
jgi:CDP-glucose 4,6-dehydratase